MAASQVPRSLGVPNLGARRRSLGRVGRRVRGLSSAGEEGRRLAGVLGAYVAVGALSVGVSLGLGRNPLAFEGWFGVRGPAAVLLSSGLGICLGAVTVGATRAMVRHAEWAKALHAALRPAVGQASDGAILALAVASATGEELLFRGLLVPMAGVLVSSLVFGLLHQVPGQARWGWMAWATVMGLVFGALFVATGSLAGPLVAHASINLVNLRFLRDNDPERRRRALGGLLNRLPP